LLAQADWPATLTPEGRRFTLTAHALPRHFLLNNEPVELFSELKSRIKNKKIAAFAGVSVLAFLMYSLGWSLSSTA
jgi:hypothetical protein